MPRKRMIDPDFWLDEEIASLPYEYRLFYIASWNFADDRGVLIDSPNRLQAQIFPYEDKDVEPIIDKLADLGKYVKFTSEGRNYLWIRKFLKHQSINRPTPSKLPAPPSEEQVTEDSRRTHAQVTEDSRLREGKGREEKLSTTSNKQASSITTVHESKSDAKENSLLAFSEEKEEKMQRPNYEVIHRWWEELTFIPSAGRGKRLASSQKTDEEMEAIRDEIERIGSLLGTHAMMEVAQRDYDHKAKDEKPATLNYYLPIWRDLSKEKPEGDQERDVKRTQERLQSYHAAPESDPVKVGQALSEMKAVIDKAREPKGEVEE